MNLLRAESYVKQFGNRSRPLSEFYDEDDMLSAAINTLFPKFEYPELAHLTMGELWASYAKAPQSVQALPTPSYQGQPAHEASTCLLAL
jgi:hypothetical protein